MILDGRTLILVADGRRARLFEEARRGGPLKERPEWLDGVTTPHLAAGTAHAGGHDKTETAFEVLLAQRVATVFADHAFDALILIAAPRALGVLRRHLSPGLKARLTNSEPHDRLTASVSDIEHAVQTMRRVSA